MKQHLSLRMAVESLEDLASDQDEIYFKGDETTPNDLFDLLCEDKDDFEMISTKGLIIGFSKRDGTYVSEGTFADMVTDRLENK